MCYLDFELRVFITDWKCGKGKQGKYLLDKL